MKKVEKGSVSKAGLLQPLWVGMVLLLSRSPILNLAERSAQNSIAEPGSDPEVIYTAVFLRHGARSNFRDLPQMDLVKRVGKGTLTEKGRREHWEIGRHNREKLFNQPLTHQQVEVVSSDFPRTKQSALMHALGVIGADYWTPSFVVTETNHQEFMDALHSEHKYLEVESPPVAIDQLFFANMALSCPKHAQEENGPKLQRYEEYQEEIADKLGKELEEAGFGPQEFVGADRWTIPNLFQFADDVVVYRTEYDKMFPGMTERLQKKLLLILGIKIALDNQNPITLSLRTNNIVKRLIKNIERAKQNHKKREKLLMNEPHSLLEQGKAANTESSALEKDIRYSIFLGHDSGVQPLMMLLGLTSFECLKAAFHDIPVRGLCERYPDFAAGFTVSLLSNGQAVVSYLDQAHTEFPVLPVTLSFEKLIQFFGKGLTQAEMQRICELQ